MKSSDVYNKQQLLTYEHTKHWAIQTDKQTTTSHTSTVLTRADRRCSRSARPSSTPSTRRASSAAPALGRGDDTVGDPHRAQIVQFDLFEFILLSKLGKQFSVEQFEAAVSQWAVPFPPLIGSEQRSQLKRQFKSVFQNVTVLVDCVQCQRCRLHAKLFSQGLGTRESIEVTEHKGSFKGSNKKGVVRCSLDSCLVLSSFFAWSPPWNYPSLNTDLDWLPKAPRWRSSCRPPTSSPPRPPGNRNTSNHTTNTIDNSSTSSSSSTTTTTVTTATTK